MQSFDILYARSPSGAVQSSYDVPKVKTGPGPRGHRLEHRNKDGKLQNLSALKLEGVDLLIFGV